MSLVITKIVGDKCYILTSVGEKLTISLVFIKYNTYDAMHFMKLQQLRFHNPKKNYLI